MIQDSSNSWKTRFAPSPSGHLHLGHLVNILYTWGLAHKHKGEVVLRIEDHDLERSKPEFIDSIYNDLEWLQLAYTESPFQSTRYPDYQDILNQLIHEKLAYPCDCSRKQILASQIQSSSELIYSGSCRDKKELKSPLAFRLLVPASIEHFEDLNDSRLTHLQAPKLQCGDFSLKDKRGNFTYQFCASIDDLVDQINVVVRGLDLFPSTGRQILLRRTLLNLGNHSRINRTPQQIHYYHHPLIVDSKGSKLSKRDLSKPLHEWKNEGWSPEELMGLCLKKIKHPSIPTDSHSGGINIETFSKMI